MSEPISVEYRDGTAELHKTTPDLKLAEEALKVVEKEVHDKILAMNGGDEELAALTDEIMFYKQAAVNRELLPQEKDETIKRMGDEYTNVSENLEEWKEDYAKLKSILQEIREKVEEAHDAICKNQPQRVERIVLDLVRSLTQKKEG